MALSAPGVVAAAWQLFVSGGSSPNWTLYGTPQQRAWRVCTWAKQMGKWVGPPNAR